MVDICLKTNALGIEKNIHDVLCYLSMSKSSQVYKDQQVRHAYSFHEGPIAESVKYKSTALFCSGQISMFVDNLMWNFLRKPQIINVETYLLRYKQKKEVYNLSGSKTDGEHMMTMNHLKKEVVKEVNHLKKDMIEAAQDKHWLIPIYLKFKRFTEQAFKSNPKKGRYPTKGVT